MQICHHQSAGVCSDRGDGGRIYADGLHRDAENSIIFLLSVLAYLT